MSLKKLGPSDSHGVIAQLEESLDFDDYVNNVCIGKQWKQDHPCLFFLYFIKQMQSFMPTEENIASDLYNAYVSIVAKIWL